METKREGEVINCGYNKRDENKAHLQYLASCNVISREQTAIAQRK